MTNKRKWICFSSVHTHRRTYASSGTVRRPGYRSNVVTGHLYLHKAACVWFHRRWGRQSAGETTVAMTTSTPQELCILYCWTICGKIRFLKKGLVILFTVIESVFHASAGRVLLCISVQDSDCMCRSFTSVSKLWNTNEMWYFCVCTGAAAILVTSAIIHCMWWWLRCYQNLKVFIMSLLMLV